MKVKKDIKFQILDWRNLDCDDNDKGIDKFTIRLFGRTEENKTIYVKVNNFTPYFYIEIPNKWDSREVDILLSSIKYKIYPKENVDGFYNYRIVKKNKFYGFTNYKKFKFVQLIFKNYKSMRSYDYAFRRPLKISNLSRNPIKLQIYESNIEPFIRCMHNREIQAVGWVNVKKYNLLNDNPSISDINIETNYSELENVNEMKINPYIIASFDIECISEDGSFPQANRDGDKIIQIGTTFSRFGENECYYKHVIALDSCDSLKKYDIDVESYKTEQQVLLAWTKLIKKINPDIITGYNIFGFDFPYMRDRAKKLGIYERFARLSRMSDEICEFKESKLSSSALGDNILRYFDMPGRVIIDLMKVVQRDYKLGSYKLDSVAAHFIKEKIDDLEINKNNNTTTIKTYNTYGLKEEYYITIYYTDGISIDKYLDGKKFKIQKLTKNSLTVNGIIEKDLLKKGSKVYWCQAKDDITARDIFSYQRKSSKHRSIIAKYCVKDCSLCNKLIAKLQIVANNIGMANVCNVPLSYIFMRGQGVKLFSIVAKKCRNKNHLIHTIRKKYNTDDKDEKEEDNKIEKLIDKLNGKEIDVDDNSSYGGAIVLEPTTGAYQEPIIVLDYSSLYPRSMIEKNLSHECHVIDIENYGELPGYKYNKISYSVEEIEEQYDYKKLKKLLRGYKNKINNYVVKEVKSKENHIIKTYEVYEKENKIYEINVNNKSIFLTKYETSIFAQKEDGTLGIIPEILNDLLDARSYYKKKKSAEKDPFMKAIWDGLQLAYKVTATNWKFSFSNIIKTNSSFNNSNRKRKIILC
jgi:DNA polymerase elongation subunit (family B)